MKAHYTEKSAVVQHITNALMTEGGGRRAYRLQLRGPAEEDLGGFIRPAVEWHVALALNEKTPTIYRNATVVFDGPNTILYV